MFLHLAANLIIRKRWLISGGHISQSGGSCTALHSSAIDTVDLWLTCATHNLNDTSRNLSLQMSGLRKSDYSSRQITSFCSMNPTYSYRYRGLKHYVVLEWIMGGNLCSPQTIRR